MYVITRNKQYFTGIGWSSEPNEAKTYYDEDNAQEVKIALFTLHGNILGTMAVQHYGDIIGEVFLLDRLSLCLKIVAFPRDKKVDNIKFFRDKSKANKFRKQLISDRINTLEKQLTLLRSLK